MKLALKIMLERTVKQKGGILLELQAIKNVYLVALPRGNVKFVVILACEKKLTRQDRVLLRRLQKRGFPVFALEDPDHIDEILTQTGGKNDET